jgi:hypothetical protein
MNMNRINLVDTPIHAINSFSLRNKVIMKKHKSKYYPESIRIFSSSNRRYNLIWFLDGESYLTNLRIKVRCL